MEFKFTEAQDELRAEVAQLLRSDSELPTFVWE